MMLFTMTRASREQRDRNVRCIAVFTQTGKTALLMSKKARPTVPIYAFTPETAYQKMGMYWGVTPFLVPFAFTVEEMLGMEQALLSSTAIQPGEQVVVISGFL